MEIILEFKNPRIKGINSKTIEWFLHASEESLSGEIAKKTPRLTSNLRDSWKPSYKKNELHISTSVSYAPYVEVGTGIYGPHEAPIEPVTANVLHAEIKGEDVFFHSSKGQEGAHMAEKGAEAFKAKVPNLFMLALQHTMSTTK